MTEKKLFGLFAAAVLLALLIFYAPFLLGLRSFFYADTTFYLEPLCRFLSDAVRSGHIPLWNPWSYCGMPQIAVAFPSIFYLPDLLLILLPFNTGLSLSMIFHQLLAAIGMFLFLRRVAMPSASAIAGALIYSLSGYMFCLSDNHSLVAGAAWFPFRLWALMRFDGSGQSAQFWRCLLCSLSIVMLITSGRPEVTIPSFALLAAYVCFCAVEHYKRAKSLLSDVVVWQLRSMFLGVALSLPALLPIAEWLSVSRRATGLLSPEVFLYSANWYDFASAVVGPSLGDMRMHGAQFRPLIANLPAYVSCAYIGPVAFTLALWGALDRNWRFRAVLLLFLVISVIACLGDSTAIAPYMVQTFPVLGFVRFPIKLLFLPIWCISILAARGLCCCMEGRAATRISFWLLLLIASWSATLVYQAGAGHLIVHFPLDRSAFQLMIEAQNMLGGAFLSAAAAGMVINLMAQVAGRWKTSKRLCCCLIVACLAATLLFDAFKWERLGADANFFQMPSFVGDHIRRLKAQNTDRFSRTLGLCFEKFTVPDSYLGSELSTATVAMFQYHRQLMKPAANIDVSIPDAFGFEGAMNGDYYYCLLHAYFESSQSVRVEGPAPSEWPLARVCAFSATDFVVTQCYRRISGGMFAIPLMDSSLFQLIFNDEKMNIRIYRAVHRMPRCYLTHSWRWANAHNTVLDATVSADKPGWLPWSNTYVEPEPGAPAPVETPGENASASFEPAQIISDVPEVLEVHVNEKDQGMLVLADSHYAGWKAELDGTSTPIYVANGFMRAVFVPAGAHTIKFMYRPDSLLLGLMLSGLAMLQLVYLAWICFKRPKEPLDA